MLAVNTWPLVNKCALGGGGESCVARVCVYIYINCPLKNVTQMGYVLQGILMRCILHFRVVAIRLLQGLGLDIPKGAIHTSGYAFIARRSRMET